MYANAGFSMVHPVGPAAITSSLSAPGLGAVVSVAPIEWLIMAAIGVLLVIVALRLDRARGTSIGRAPAPFPAPTETARAHRAASPLGLAA